MDPVEGTREPMGPNCGIDDFDQGTCRKSTDPDQETCRKPMDADQETCRKPHDPGQGTRS